MDLTKKTIKQSTFIVLILTVISMLINWQDPNLRFVGFFGKPELVPVSIVIGGIIGVLNLSGLAWGIGNLLGTYKASAKLVFLSLLRLLILFGLIIALTAMRLVNLLGLLAGMSAVFLILIKEGLSIAREQSKEL